MQIGADNARIRVAGASNSQTSLSLERPQVNPKSSQVMVLPPRPSKGVILAAPVALSARRPFIPVFDNPRAARPFLAALPPARREAYDRTARLLLVSQLLAELHRAAHALWTGGVPVLRADVTPCILSKSLESISRWRGNPEQAWYNAVEARLCIAVLDLVIISTASADGG